MTKYESLKALLIDELSELGQCINDKEKLTKAFYCRGLVNSALVCGVFTVHDMDYWHSQINKVRVEE